jgi:hypothetical protein
MEDSNSDSVTNSVQESQATSQTQQQALLDTLRNLLDKRIDPPNAPTSHASNTYRNITHTTAPNEKAAAYYAALHQAEQAAEHLTHPLTQKDKETAYQQLQHARGVLADATPVLDSLIAEQAQMADAFLDQEEKAHTAFIERTRKGPAISQSGELFAIKTERGIDQFLYHHHLTQAHENAKTALPTIVKAIDAILEKATGRALGGESTPPRDLASGQKWTERA